MASTSNTSSYQQVEDFAPSASTSGGSTNSGNKLLYDVFINHFKHPLGGAIYKELDVKGLKVFLNSEELELEDEEIEAAIKSAWLYIPIFSEEYAQSSRCLEELSLMHNRRKGAKIVPIFCRVKTDDVRYVKEVYAFDPEKVGHNSEKLEEWKKALFSVSHYIGSVVESKEEEDMLLKTITEWVAKEGKMFQEFASANTGSSIQSQVGFAASTSICGGSIMFVRKLDYDVFINHRGPDVKRTLAIAIYKMLTDMGLKVFLDSEELTWGAHFPSLLEDVMKSVWLNIAIFSESYAESKWCLRELSFMYQTGTKVIPIFYHTHPLDIRYTNKGAYAAAFDGFQRKGRCTPEKLREWTEALKNASNYLGSMVNSKEDEDELLKNIADWVANEGKKVKEFASASTSSSLQPQVEFAPSTPASGGCTSQHGPYVPCRLALSSHKKLEDMPMRDLRYNVFINHRGTDGKRILAKAIYKTLKDMGLKAFLDSEEIQLAEDIGSVIEEVLRRASLHIAIFSQNYANSPWCLSELSLMLQTGTRIIPVFYYIHPSDVRYARKGAYAAAFDEFEKKGRVTPEKVRGWTEAFYHASLNVGFIVRSKEDEDMLLENIGDLVAKELKWLQ